MKATALVYIMGRGHSGSTVLDAMLGNSTDMESIGELVSGIGRPNETCSCARTVLDCEFWKQIRSEFEVRSGLDWESGVALLIGQAHIAKLVSTLFARRDSSRVQQLIKANEAMTGSIQHVSGKRCVVDSSKEHTRGLFLARFLPATQIIHLVRNPEGILASNLYRTKSGTGFKFLRHTYHSTRLTFFFLALSSINWVAGNLLAELVRLLAPSRVLRVRYEDLCADPRSVLGNISAFVGYDLGDIADRVEQGRQMKIGHNIGGNEMRTKGSFTFDPRAGSSRPLPRFYRILARAIAWPIMLAYGYRVLR